MALELSKYGKSLPACVQSQYTEKVMLCGDRDTLLFTLHETATDHDLYPKVQDVDVKDYVFGKMSFITRVQFKAHKALEAHDFLTSGWVQAPRLGALSCRNVVVIGK
ncbi:hypothetical protein HPB47_013221, partial [Ixodes persulcatus]